MAIMAYVGLPRSGKSYDAVVNQILPALESGRRVVTNIPLNRDEVRKRTPNGEIVELPLDMIVQEPHKIDDYATAGTVLVIDELWRLWPAGVKTDKIPQPFKSLLAEHGHRVDAQGRSMQIVFVTQDLAQIAAFARQLVEQTVFHTKLTALGSDKSYRIDICNGPVVGATQPPEGKIINSIIGRYRPHNFPLYTSHTMSEFAGSGADEKRVDNRGVFWKQGKVVAGLVLVPLLVAASLYGLHTIGESWGMIGDDSTELSEAQPVESSPSAPPRPAATVATRSPPARIGPVTTSQPTQPPPVVQTAPRRDYRIAGVVENLAYPARSRALITDGQHYITLMLRDCKRHLTGWYSCEYDGQNLSVFGSAPKRL